MPGGPISGGSGSITRPIVPGIADADIDSAAGIALSKLASSGTLNGISGAGSGAATLGALQTNVSSQYISASNTRGFIRLTTGGVAPSVGNVVASIAFSAALGSVPYIHISPVMGSNLFGDSVTINAPGGMLFLVANPTINGFDIKVSAAISAGISYGLIFGCLL